MNKVSYLMSQINNNSRMEDIQIKNKKKCNLLIEMKAIINNKIT